MKKINIKQIIKIFNIIKQKKKRSKEKKIISYELFIYKFLLFYIISYNTIKSYDITHKNNLNN